MKKILAIIALGACAALPSAAFSQEQAPARVDHYQAKAADGVEEAVANLREANRKLAELLAGEVGEYDIHDIHSLSYTLEESLLRIADELRQLHGIVADMHFATEGQQREAVIDYGEAYLSEIGKIFK